jgi:GNAT superfamily N-acetyltransferase
MLTLRRSTPDDSEFAYQANRLAFGPYVEQLGGWEEAAQRELHQRRFSTQTYRIINFEGQDVGILASVAMRDCLKVNQLFILPAHQGQGIGRRCMLLVMAEAAGVGAAGAAAGAEDQPAGPGLLPAAGVRLHRGNGYP